MKETVLKNESGKQSQDPTDNFVPLQEKSIKSQMNVEDILATYQPEKEFQFVGNGKTPYQEFLEKFYYKKNEKGEYQLQLPDGMALTGTVLGTKVVEGKTILQKIKITSAADYKTFLEKATEKEKTALKETTFFGPGSFPQDGFADDSTNPMGIAIGDQEYTPLMGGPFSKQLYLTDYLSMHAKAFEMWNHNPIAHQIIKITTYFVLGRGFKVKFKNANAQAHWDNFESKNDFINRTKTWCDQESRDGELMVRIFKDPLGKTGDILVRAVDPSTIWEIVTDPDDIEKVYYYHQQYPTAYQVFYSQNMINLPSTQYIIKQIPAHEMLHYKLNCNSNEKRGRSDLFPVMTWLKRIKDFYTARVIRAIMQSCVVWKTIIDGDQAAIDEYIQKFGTNPPKAGTLHVENKASTTEPMTVDIKAADARDDGDALLNLISVGVGIPKEYLGLGDRSTRATALVASEPGYKKFQDRQEHFKKIIGDIAKIVTAEGMRANVIPSTEKVMPDNLVQKIITAVRGKDFYTAIKLLWTGVKGGVTVGVDKEFEVIIPEIIIENRSEKIKDLTMMQVNEWISKETAATIAGKEMHIENYEYAEEKVKIAKDVASGNPYGQYEPMLSPAGGVKYKPLVNQDPNAPQAGLAGADKNAIKKVSKEAKQAIMESAAQKLPDTEFDPKELKMGTDMEMEHTDDAEFAKAIAKDHLAQWPNYYTELVKFEKSLDQKDKK